MPQRAPASRQDEAPLSWYQVGRATAAAYLSRRDWLYRRVESIEFTRRHSARRRVSVDFEIPDGLPLLDHRAREGGMLVPVAAFQKWPPWTGFDFVGPDEHPISLYTRETNTELDLGLVVGIAESVVGRLSPAMADAFADIVTAAEPEPVAFVDQVREIGLELGRAVAELPDQAERAHALQRAQDTIDLAARLGNSSLLWALVTGTPGTDRIVKFSYIDPRDDPNQRWKRILIGCSWWQRRIDLWLPHAGLHTAYHLDVLPPGPGLVLRSAEMLVFPGPQGLTPRAARRQEPCGATPPAPTEYGMIRDGRAVVDRGYRDVPSHRMVLRLLIAASREGLITGCVISAAVIAALMTVTFLALTPAAKNIDATVVLLAAVPVVLGYVLVRPGETAFERYQLAGVRAVALLSGALPILGAVTLMLTHEDDAASTPTTRNVWAALLILSLLLTAALAMSWFHAATPPTHDQPTGSPAPSSGRIAPRSALLFAAAIVIGSLLESQPYSHVARPMLAAYLVHNKARVLGATLIAGLGATALYGLLVGAWQGLVPRLADRAVAEPGQAAEHTRQRALFRWLVVYPGVLWIWATVLLLAVTAWLTLTVSRDRGGERLAWFSRALDVTANATLAPAALVVLALTVWLAWRADLLRAPLDAGLVLVGEAGLAALVLIGARAVSCLWPSVAHVAPTVPWVGLGIWVAIAGTLPRLARRRAN